MFRIELARCSSGLSEFDNAFMPPRSKFVRGDDGIRTLGGPHFPVGHGAHFIFLLGRKVEHAVDVIFALTGLFDGRYPDFYGTAPDEPYPVDR